MSHTFETLFRTILTMSLKHLLFVLLACYVLQAGSFSALPLLQGRWLQYSKNAARSPLARARERKAPPVQVPKEAVCVPSAPDVPPYKEITVKTSPAIRQNKRKLKRGKERVKKNKSQGKLLKPIVPSDIAQVCIRHGRK